MGGISLLGKALAASKALRGFVCFSAVLLLLWAGSALSAVEDLPKVLKISGEDRAAVVETANGAKRLVKEGDTVAGYTITEIAEGRMVLDGSGASGPEKLIVTLLNGEQKIMRIRKVDGAGNGAAVMVVPDEVMK